MNDLTEKDLHCIARIFQGVIYKDGDMFHCCRYCMNEKECTQEVKTNQTLHFDRVQKKLQDITGVYLGLDSHDIEKKFQLPTNKPVCKQ